MIGSRHQNYKNKNSEAKSSWYNWLINLILEILKKRSVVQKTKL